MKKMIGWMASILLLGTAVTGFSAGMGCCNNPLTTPYNHYNHSLFVSLNGHGVVSENGHCDYQFTLSNINHNLNWFTDCNTHEKGMMSSSNFFDAWGNTSNWVRTTIRVDHGTPVVANLKLVSTDGNQATFKMKYVGGCNLDKMEGSTEVLVNGGNIKFPVPEGYVNDNPSCNVDSVYGCHTE